MSETKTHIGKVKEIDVGNLNKWCENHVKTAYKNYTIGSEEYLEAEAEGYEDGFIGMFKEELEYESNYKIVGDKVYEIIEDRQIEYEDIAHAVKAEDGTISFVLQFYNGGTYFGEMLEEALKTLKS